MPERRDSISLVMDISFAELINWRGPNISSGSRNGGRDSFSYNRQASVTPFRWRDTPMMGPLGRGSSGSPRIGGSPNSALSRGRENTSPVLGSGRGRSILPAGDPRRPLLDITAAVEAIERTILQDRIIHDSSASTSVAHLEQDISMTNQEDKDADSSCLTPQQKLLNNIDTVKKSVMEELRKLKRTPSAKKAERQKRVETLMSIR